ncbi:MAG: intermembrane transport protein PqiB [Bdellovibrionales bacterium]
MGRRQRQGAAPRGGGGMSNPHDRMHARPSRPESVASTGEHEEEMPQAPLPPELPPELPSPDIPENPPETSGRAMIRRRYFSAVWVIPIIAAVIAGYLAVRSYMQQGPAFTITFKSGEGLSVGQTQIKYKAVTLGTVEDITLAPDRRGIVVHARMKGSARALLTDHARFWIVRPAFNTTNIPDIQLLVTGTYIQLDPGAPGGTRETEFTGLYQPPVVQPDDGAGKVFNLTAERLGPVGRGSPVYFRDIHVGEVLSYDIGDGYGPMKLGILVREPYTRFVRAGSRFWNASGFTVKLAGGLHIEFQSLKSVFAGGIAFMMPPGDPDAPPASANSTFPLYDNRKAAELADGNVVPCVTNFETPIKDLAPGSPVQIYGMPVGEVTDVRLLVDPAQGKPKVRVAFNIQPDLAFGARPGDDTGATQILRHLVEKGMRVKLASSDLIGGQQVLSLQFVPQSSAGGVTMEGNSIVLPGAGGGFDNIAGALGDVAEKLNRIPLDDIGRHLNHLLASADKNFGGREMEQAMRSLSATLANAEDVSRKARENLSPALERLPEISVQLQQAVRHANEFLASIDTGYGNGSDFQRNIKRVMDEVNDATRSIRLLADYLERHPEAIVQGKSIGKEGP